MFFKKVQIFYQFKPSNQRRSTRPVSTHIERERDERHFRNKNHIHTHTEIENWGENLNVSRSTTTNDDDSEDGRDGDCLDPAPVGSPPDPRRSHRIQLQVPSPSLLHRLLRSFHALTGTCSLLAPKRTRTSSSVLDFVVTVARLWCGGRITSLEEGFDF